MKKNKKKCLEVKKIILIMGKHLRTQPLVYQNSETLRMENLKLE